MGKMSGRPTAFEEGDGLRERWDMMTSWAARADAAADTDRPEAQDPKPSGAVQVVAPLRFTSGVQEAFAVTELPGRRYPELTVDDESLLEISFTVPDAALADVPASLRDRPNRPVARRGRPGTGVRRAGVRDDTKPMVLHQRGNLR